MSQISNIVTPIVTPIVVPSVGVDSGAIELNLTSSAEIDAWITKYSGAYTCNDVWYVEDNLGVYNQVQTNVMPIKGARLTGGAYYKTDISGDPITGTIGMAIWPATTNRVLSVSYRDFTHANWTATNGSVTAGAVTLIDGTSVSDKNTLTASGANCTLIHDAYVSASGIHASGLFIKRKTGTGVIEVTTDNGANWEDVTAQVAGDSGWHLGQTTQTVTNPQVGIRLVTSGDAVYLDWAQMDDGKKRVSVHPIIGEGVLAVQDFHFANDGLIDDSEGSIYVEAQLLPDDQIVSSQGMIVALTTAIRFTYADSTNNIRSFDGTNVATLISGLVGYSKLVNYWSGTINQITSNGTSSSVGTYDGSWGASTIYVGRPDGSEKLFNGIISKVTFDSDSHDATYWETETAST